MQCRCAGSAERLVGGQVGRAGGEVGPQAARSSSPVADQLLRAAGFLLPEELTAPESLSLRTANLRVRFRVFVPEPRLKRQQHPERVLQRVTEAGGQAAPRRPLVSWGGSALSRGRGLGLRGRRAVCWTGTRSRGVEGLSRV